MFKKKCTKMENPISINRNNTTISCDAVKVSTSQHVFYSKVFNASRSALTMYCRKFVNWRLIRFFTKKIILVWLKIEHFARYLKKSLWHTELKSRILAQLVAIWLSARHLNFPCDFIGNNFFFWFLPI